MNFIWKTPWRWKLSSARINNQRWRNHDKIKRTVIKVNSLKYRIKTWQSNYDYRIECVMNLHDIINVIGNRNHIVDEGRKATKKELGTNFLIFKK